MNEMIAEFDALVPPKSLLGRELKALIKERDRQALAFDSASDKMQYDTSAYRRSSMAIERFLRQWLPRIREANARMADDAASRLAAHQESVLSHNYGITTPVDRRTESRIWMHYTVERYRLIRPSLARIRRYNPGVISELLMRLKTFRHELRLWKYARIPFDGSQAMASMIQVIACLTGLGAFYD